MVARIPGTERKGRTMTRLFAVAMMCAVAIGLVGAADTAVPTPKPDAMKALVEQLGSDRYADREAAAAALEKIGPPALPALRDAARSESPEVRERAAVLSVKLKRIAESNNRLVAKRVKLDYKDIPLGTAVNDLKARTGLHIALDGNHVLNPLRKVTCETAELPVWEALEVFCAAAGLRELYVGEIDLPKSKQNKQLGGFVPPPQPPNADSVGIILMDGRPDRLPGDRSTAVRVVALPPRFPGHKVTLGTGEVTLCLDVTPAPGLNWLEVVSVRINRVIDSSDRLGASGSEKPLPPPIEQGGTIVFGGAGVAMRFDQRGNPIYPETMPNPRVVPVPLKVATISAKSLKRLEGVVFGEMNVVNQQIIAIADPRKNTNVAFNGPGDVKFTVLELKEAAGQGGMGLLRAQLEYPSSWSTNARRRGFNPGFNFGFPEPPQHPSLAKTVQAFDASGKPFPLTGNNSYTDIGGDDGQTSIQTMEFRFRPGIGVPAKLVVTGPKVVLVEIPFAMENVQLP